MPIGACVRIAVSKVRQDLVHRTDLVMTSVQSRDIFVFHLNGCVEAQTLFQGGSKVSNPNVATRMQYSGNISVPHAIDGLCVDLAGSLSELGLLFENQ